MSVAILINGEKQENLIQRSINSCLRQTYKKTQIIVVYNNLKNEKLLKKKYKNNIFFLKINKKIKNPTQDQLYKIKKSLPHIKKDYIFLLDGDDYFLKTKIANVLKNIKNKNILVQDNYYQLEKNKKKLAKQQNYKEFKIYKCLVNNWPRRISTSCQAMPTSILRKFFKNNNPFEWKYLAIDAQLAIFCKYKFKVKNLDEAYTIKNIINNSVDKKYQKVFNKYFWLRRMEQHYLNDRYKKKSFKGLDFLLCSLINLFIKK